MPNIVPLALILLEKKNFLRFFILLLLGRANFDRMVIIWIFCRGSLDNVWCLISKIWPLNDLWSIYFIWRFIWWCYTLITKLNAMNFQKWFLKIYFKTFWPTCSMDKNHFNNISRALSEDNFIKIDPVVSEEKSLENNCPRTHERATDKLWSQKLILSTLKSQLCNPKIMCFVLIRTHVNYVAIGTCITYIYSTCWLR
jgi:hypothetical protein